MQVTTLVQPTDAGRVGDYYYIVVKEKKTGLPPHPAPFPNFTQTLAPPPPPSHLTLCLHLPADAASPSTAIPEIMSDQIASADKNQGKAGETVDSAGAAALLSSATDAGITIHGSESSPSDSAAATLVEEKSESQPVRIIKDKTKSEISPSDSPAAGLSPDAVQPVGVTKEKSESESSHRKVQPVGVIKEKTRRRESLDAVRVRAKAIKNAIILLSAVVALFILTTMWLSRGQPLQVASVWCLSLLICLCCFFWVWFLKVAMGAGMVFMFLTYGLLVADVAHYVFGPKIGMVCVHFDTHLAALFVGYSFAEHWVKTAKKNDISLPKNDQQANKVQFLLLWMYFVAITICAAVAVVWILYHAEDYAENELLLYVLMPLLGVLILWVSYVDVSLRGAFLGQGGMAMVFAYYGLIIMMYMLSLITLGHIAATITTWIAILGMSGFLGFSLSIYNSYK